MHLAINAHFILTHPTLVCYENWLESRSMARSSSDCFRLELSHSNEQLESSSRFLSQHAIMVLKYLSSSD